MMPDREWPTDEDKGRVAEALLPVLVAISRGDDPYALMWHAARTALSAASRPVEHRAVKADVADYLPARDEDKRNEEEGVSWEAGFDAGWAARDRRARSAPPVDADRLLDAVRAELNAIQPGIWSGAVLAKWFDRRRDWFKAEAGVREDGLDYTKTETWDALREIAFGALRRLDHLHSTPGSMDRNEIVAEGRKITREAISQLDGSGVRPADEERES
jgi:hypothetical protein